MLCAIETLMPHRAPMQWIKALTDCTATTATATACFDPNENAVKDGALSEMALVECVAQTAAAALGYRAQVGAHTTAPNKGMLVAVSNFRIQSPPPVGQDLLVEVREVKRLGAMLLISGTILCDGRLIASGELSLYA
jgi:predicted hotdog family 3-hydroxylacyl-ACP dehydratase